MVILDAPGGGGKGEEVVDGGGHLERALVAVTHDAGDPLGIDHPGADDPRDLLVEGADPGRLRPGVVGVVNRGLCPRKHADGGGDAALELVVVVGIEDVVLPVVLVLHHRLDVPQPGLEQAVGRPAFRAGAVGVPAPGDIGAGQVGVGPPAALVDQRLQPGAIGPGLGAVHPTAGKRRRLVRAGAGGDKPFAFVPHPGGEGIVGFRLVEGGDGARRRIEQVDQPRERVAEEPRDPQRHVHPRPVEDVERQDLESRHPPRRRIPGRPHPHQRQRLGDVVAAGTHVAGAPGGERQGARPGAVVLGIALDQQSRRLPAQGPGRRRRHGAGVDRIEVASRRQHIGPAAGRRSGRSRLDETAVEAGQQTVELGLSACLDRRTDALVDLRQHRQRPRP